MRKVVDIHAVKSPNPLAMKFELPALLLTNEAYSFHSKEEAGRSPLALKLFGFDYVARVFITKNFVTVSKKDEFPSWDEVMIDARIVIKKHLEAGEPLFDFDSTQVQEKPKLDVQAQGISDLIEEAILPATWQDGGQITFESFNEGVVKVKMAGACVACPFAPRTLKHGVEVLLQRSFPEVTAVTSDNVDWSETQQE
ncbi:MAG TPA: NifU family protein [Bacteroidetes bacterium]|nr:NifU family protein [Bacteroidota bacterium]